MHPIEQLAELFERESPRMIGISDQIWALAELRYAERTSASIHADALAQSGFKLQRPLADIPTAFSAEWGEGGPVIALLGEYDALSGMSQESGALQCKPSTEYTSVNGHGCGHHLLGAAAHLAALAVQEYLRRKQLPGRVRFYGCPAEEGGSGKTFMARAGVFDDVAAAITWHPASYTSVFSENTLANIQVSFEFHGRAAHASASPHLGRSALDAVELMNVGVNYLREHMPSDARVHYAVTNTGGLSPNVVQAKAEVLYLIRAANNAQAAELYARVQNVAKGAALMTDCQVVVKFEKACSNLLQNNTLNQTLYEELLALGPLPVGPGEHAQAQGHFATLDANAVAEASSHLGAVLRGKTQPSALFDRVKEYDPHRVETLTASTDVGDVSWVTPTVQCFVACFAFGTPFHSWQMVAQGKTTLAHIGMVQAAKAMAATAIRLLEDKALLAAARQDFDDARGEQGYVCPIPAEVQPLMPA